MRLRFVGFRFGVKEYIVEAEQRARVKDVVEPIAKSLGLDPSELLITDGARQLYLEDELGSVSELTIYPLAPGG